jgi:amino acid transporter
MNAAQQARQLTLLDCFGLGINGIIGSGIFILPAALQRRAGGLSPLAWLAVGGLCTLIALTFAEAASRTDRSGGPYRYACDAFGPLVGFGVGWITMVSALLGYAAVARGFAEHAAFLVGGAGDFVAEAVAVVAIVGALGLINAVGIKPSARIGDGLSFVKIGGLLLFIAVGIFHVHGGISATPPSPLPGERTGIWAAAFAGMFACTGFEFVPVPAGDTINPKRAIGLAMSVSVVGATLIYALIQWIAASTLPGMGASERPIVDAARAFAGPSFAALIAFVATLSALGYCASSAMVVPLYVESIAQDRFLPRLFQQRSARFGTPVAAIVAVSLLTALLAIFLDFTHLADVSNVAVVVQYQSTCIAVLLWRRRDPSATGFRLPFGPLIPVLSFLGTLFFLVQVSRVELYFGAALLVGGLVLGALTRLLAPSPMQ